MEKLATFAGGCFWCMEKPFNYYEGILKVVPGYIGGNAEGATYRKVCTGKTSHKEAIQITYDENLIDYKILLDIFWKQIDPFDAGGQFADRGEQYKTAIFYQDEKQKQIILESIKQLEENVFKHKKIQTEVLALTDFYEAEKEHIKYFEKNKNHYNNYYKNSGRHNFVKSTWDGSIDLNKKLKEKLSDLSYEVTQNDMTELPYDNKYFDMFDKGIYVDIVDGMPLFSSKHKINSSCGWPSFSKPIKDTAIYRRNDYSMGMMRVEVRSLSANSHLGHVFEDGPIISGGLRYCINSAALKFIPYEKMEESGYVNYLKFVV